MTADNTNMQTFLSSMPPADKVLPVNALTEQQLSQLSLLLAASKVSVQQTDKSQLILQLPTTKITLQTDAAKVVLPEGKNQQFFVASLSDSTDANKSQNVLVSYQRSSSIVKPMLQQKESFTSLLSAIRARVPESAEDRVSLKVKVEKSTPSVLVVTTKDKTAVPLTIPVDNPPKRPRSGDTVDLIFSPSGKQLSVMWENPGENQVKLTSLSSRSSSYDALMLHLLKTSGLTLSLPKLKTLHTQPSAPNAQASLLSRVHINEGKMALSQSVTTPLLTFPQVSPSISPINADTLPSIANANLWKATALANSLPAAKVYKQENVNAIESVFQGLSKSGPLTKADLLANMSVDQKQLVHGLLVPLIRQTLPMQDKQVSMESITSMTERVLKAQTVPVKLKESLAQWTAKEINVHSVSEVVPQESKKSDATIKAAEPVGTESMLKRILTTDALPISMNAINAVSAQANTSGNFVATLLVILQVFTANRTQTRASQAMADAQASNGEKKTTEKGGTTQRPRAETTPSANESRLLKQIASLLAGHQQAKLRQADSSLNGQDQLHYVLPALFGSKSPVELLIKREYQDEKDSEKRQVKQAFWHLTMKLDVGDLGSMLAKTRLQGDTVSIDLYTESQPLIKKIKATLHQLEQRLKNKGININTARVQTGVIPASLADKSIQLLETRV
ncbi:flagellar hook-length control protein FliK [Alteromonas sediminis]|uniref:Flagellar hook-length control protein FliK n=1 Tax=Alteromonas sediminis TaxID=2259342 RepID=A0A3N5Y500_9ALTE|nr:flagellar hook-length control protein FliK [Alteromonas sediminis]RPJ68273.1 flagellar hook-length control protein FliK [Alteromonas sediminis]